MFQCAPGAVLCICLQRKELPTFIPHPTKMFSYNLGCCAMTLQILTPPSVLTSESVPHLYRLSPLIQLSAQVTQILEDSFDQGPNEYVWKELRGASRLCTRGKHYSSRALNTSMAGCLSGNSTSGRISL